MGEVEFIDACANDWCRCWPFWSVLSLPLLHWHCVFLYHLFTCSVGYVVASGNRRNKKKKERQTLGVAFLLSDLFSCIYLFIYLLFFVLFCSNEPGGAADVCQRFVAHQKMHQRLGIRLFWRNVPHHCIRGNDFNAFDSIRHRRMWITMNSNRMRLLLACCYQATKTEPLILDLSIMPVGTILPDAELSKIAVGIALPSSVDVKLTCIAISNTWDVYLYMLRWCQFSVWDSPLLLSSSTLIVQSDVMPRLVGGGIDGLAEGLECLASGSLAYYRVHNHFIVCQW